MVLTDIDFGQFILEGISLTQPTDVAFGPDGRLYILEQSGRLHRAEVAFEDDAYRVVSNEVIDLVYDIPNHDVLGNPIPDEGRLALGLHVAGTAQNPDVYVSSADPNFPYLDRGNADPLDSNSGIVSRLRMDEDGTWEKLDLVRGLARGNTGHGINDMDIRWEMEGDTLKPFLYLSTGGMTNSGGVGSFFFFQPETVYAAAVLRIDLDRLDAMPVQTTDQLGRPLPKDQWYVYDFPTVDDPTRDAAGDINPLSGYDIFGSNNGLNQVRLDPDGPVEIYATGLRNAVGLTVTHDNRLFTSDNGPSDCCDRPPVFIDDVATNFPNDGRRNPTTVQSPDAFYEITEGTYYGHPNPVRASGPQAGLYVPGTTSEVLIYPEDWDQVLAGFDATTTPWPDDGTFIRNGDPGDNALWTFSSSVNGIDEYRGTFFDGALENAFVLSRFTFSGSSSQDIIFLTLNEDRTAVVEETTLDLQNFGGALGLTSLGDTDPFPGTIWVAGQIANQIAILQPNGAPVTPPSPPPADDQDRDGLRDYVTDPLPFDDRNGGRVVLAPGESEIWTFSPALTPPGPSGSIFNLGLTGAMTDGEAESLGALFEDTNFFPGGAVGQLTLIETGPGTPFGPDNTLRDAGQFAFTTTDDADIVTISADLSNPFPDLLALDDLPDGAGAGIAIGPGTQSDFVYFGTLVQDGRLGLAVIFEQADAQVAKAFLEVPVFGDAQAVNPGASVLLDLIVSKQAGTVVPHYAVDFTDRAPDGSETVRTVEGFLPTITLEGDVLAALRGDYVLEQDASTVTDPALVSSGPVVSLVATTNGASGVVPTSWNSVLVETKAQPETIAALPEAVAIWDGTGSTSASLADASGNGLTGGGRGGVSVTQDGVVGAGLSFDGSDGSYIVPHDDQFLLDEGTVMLWVNPDRDNRDQGLLSKDASFNGTGGHLDIRMLSGGQIWTRLQNAESSQDVVLQGPDLAVGTWSHVAVSWGQGGVTLSVNGELVASDSYTGGLGSTAGGAGNFEPIALGATLRSSGDLSADPLRQFFDGQLDEVAISGTQLDADTIRALYDTGLSGVGLADTLAVNAAPEVPVLSPGVVQIAEGEAGPVAMIRTVDPDGDDVALSLADDFGGVLALDQDMLVVTVPLDFEALPDGFIALGDTQAYAYVDIMAEDGRGGVASASGLVVVSDGAEDIPGDDDSQDDGGDEHGTCPNATPADDDTDSDTDSGTDSGTDAPLLSHGLFDWTFGEAQTSDEGAAPAPVAAGDLAAPPFLLDPVETDGFW